MAEKRITFKKLAHKGFHVSVPVAPPDQWKALIVQDKAIPRSFAQLRALGQSIYGMKRKRTKQSIWSEVVRPSQRTKKLPGAKVLSTRRGLYMRPLEECLEELYARYYAGLRSPYITLKQRALLEKDMDDATPMFENNHDTDHFVLRWTNESSHAADNIADATIVEQTGEFLETAWDRYVSVFGKAPYVPVGATKIEVVFQDIGGFGLASPADGPIQFDALSWVNEPGIRQPTSAHELFHKLQYAFGYRTKHTPSGDYKWFSEGTASWAEVFVWQRLSRRYKLLDLFSNPDLHLYQASYRALPYWIFFEARQKDSATDNPLISLMQKYEDQAAGTAFPERVAYAEVIDEDWAPNNVYGNPEGFFALFSRDRRLGHWRTGPAGGVYPTILGPDDNPIEPVLTITEADLGVDETYLNTGNVSGFGSDYYRLNFEAGTNGRALNINVDGSVGGDFSYYLIWEKNGRWKRASFPFNVTGNYGTSDTIDLSAANSLMLIISGRGTGGAYNLTASIS